MKKVISLLVVFIFSIALLSTNKPVKATTFVDDNGVDPWISIFHDSSGTGYTPSDVVPPLKETDSWPYETGGGQRSWLGGGVVVYNGILYTSYMPDFGGSTTEVIAIDIETAEEVWDNKAQVQGSFAFGKGPVLDIERKLLYIASSKNVLPQKGVKVGYVTALNLEDGSEAWTVEVQGVISGGPVYAENGIFVKSIFFKDTKDPAFKIAGDGSMITKCDAENDGTILWETPLEGAWYTEWDSPPIVSDGMVYVSTSNFDMDPAKGQIRFGTPATVYALSAESGNIEWQSSGEAEDTRLCGGVCADEKNVYFSYTSVEGTAASLVMLALAKDTGEKQWDYSTSGIGYWPTPIANNEYVFIISQDGNLIAINKEGGKKAWSKKVGDLSQGSAYAVTDKYIIAAGSKINANKIAGTNIQMFDLEAKGKKVWGEETEERIGHIAIYGKYVFLSGRNNLLCYKSETPELSLNPDKVDLGQVERATMKDIKISIKNNGIPGLEGKVTVSEPWMKVDTTDVTDDTKSLIVTIDTTGLQLIDYTGKVNFASNGGNKTINVSMKIIDKTAPIITWDYSTLIKIGDDYYTKEKQYKLKGTTEPTAVVTVQEKPAEIDAEGKFEIVVDLVEGKNEIAIETKDDVPNPAKTTLVLYLDTKAPLITLSTENYTLVKEASSYIMGQVDDKEAVVTINDEPIQLTPTGSFAKIVSINRGENKFIIKAVDKIGNEYSTELVIIYPEKKLIILIVGKKEAEVNGDVIKMDVSPLIIKGSTMVPLRSLGDFIGAKVDYEPKTQKITFTLYGKVIELFIGRKTARVNGEPVELSVPPTIISGRTLVPLRFVSEKLGAKVDYEVKTRTITITYPDPT